MITDEQRKINTAKSKRWRDNNIEKSREIGRRWRERHPQQEQERQRKLRTQRTTTGEQHYWHSKYLAQRRGIAFLWSLAEFLAWYKQQIRICYYCKRELTRTPNHKATDETFDRLDNSVGYTENNVVLCCRRCNSMKGDWLTAQQTKEIAEKYFGRKE